MGNISKIRYNNRSVISKINSIKPGGFFLVVSLISGVLFIIITPPFQVPDEINHFYKSYQISNGNLLSEKMDNRLGGYVPISFIEVTKPFLDLRWNLNSKTNFKTIHELLSVPLNEDDEVFVDFPNTALYSPVSYIPQAFSIFVLKKLNISPLIIFYGARIFTLLIWILCIWLAIKITPIYKWLFVLLALLPMSVFTNMSLSADVVTNIFAFLLIAYFLKVTFQNKKLDLKDFLIIIFLTIMLASAKIVYTPIVFLFLLIPLKQFKNTKKFYFYFIVLLLTGFGTALLWSELINNLYIPYKNYNAAYRDAIDLLKCGSIHEQLDYILGNRLYIFRVFINSMYQTFDMYYSGYIGTFGWLDTKLPVWLIHISYIVIIFTAIFENNEKLSFNNFQRIVILASLFATIAFILLSQHLTWDCIGDKIIATIQGRYFIPAFPLLFIMFNNSRYNRNFLIKVTVIVFSIVLLLFSIWTLYSRYYISPEFDNIQCNAEELTSDKLFKTSIPNIFLENGNRQSNKYSKSGDFSIELFSENPYGFTYRYFNGELGDIINIEVWRFGKSGGIILAGKSGKGFYLTSSEIIETDANGWDRLQLNYTLQSDMKGKEIGIYLYNNNKDPNYFDDLSISINKLN